MNFSTNQFISEVNQTFIDHPKIVSAISTALKLHPRTRLIAVAIDAYAALQKAKTKTDDPNAIGKEVLSAIRNSK